MMHLLVTGRRSLQNIFPFSKHSLELMINMLLTMLGTELGLITYNPVMALDED